jgi:hypothetical protein
MAVHPNGMRTVGDRRERLGGREQRRGKREAQESAQDGELGTDRKIGKSRGRQPAREFHTCGSFGRFVPKLAGLNRGLTGGSLPSPLCLI